MIAVAALLACIAGGEDPIALLVARARAGTAAYRDPEVARAAGYRPVGPDFPGMGRHWVHPRLILRDSLDPATPPILEYAELEGRLTLVGVAYARLVRGGAPPGELRVPAGAWHYHAGSVEEESFVRTHAALGHEAPEAGAGPRIAVLHAWIWLDNPDGVLATDNWMLPYARFGWAPPPGGSRAAAQALALAAGDGGRAYVEALVRAVGRPGSEDAAQLVPVIARHHAAARDIVSRAAAGPPPVLALARCWAVLWDEIHMAVEPAVWARLDGLR